jgi:tetratricopeptide (TPR) repeat protein
MNGNVDNAAKANRPRVWGLAAILVFGVILAYQPVCHAGFIWDDDVYVTDNQLLTAPDGWSRIWFSTDSPSQYFPLVYTVLRVERALWGLDPSGYHWVNLLWHAANALLVWRLLTRLKIPGAWLGAALFAFHPVEVESVAWVTELKNLLSLLFSLLALLSWVKFTEEGRIPRWRDYVLCLAFFALALFSKTTACTLPAALILILWLQKKPLTLRRWLQMTPFAGGGLGMGLLSVWWERHHQFTVGKTFAIPLLDRLLIASRAVWFYAGKLLWPFDLSFSYPRWNIDPAQPTAYLWLVAGLLLAWLIYVTRRFFGRSLAVTVLFYVATLSPMIGFIMEYTFKYSFVADHYQYMASIGPLALAAVALHRIPVEKIKIVLCALLLLTLATLTWRQSRNYFDSETLWRATLLQNPESAMVQNNLSHALLEKGQVDEAIRRSQFVLSSHPEDATAELNLGYGLLQKGDVDQSIAHSAKALTLEPNLPNAAYNLGQAYLKKGQFDTAVHFFEQSIQIKPDFAKAYCNLGYTLLQEHHIPEALAAYHKALEMDPHYALAHNDLGSIFLQQGQTAQALEQFEQAVASLPTFAEAHYNLAQLYRANGRNAEAITHYQKAVDLDPNLVPAYSGLAAALADAGQYKEAIATLERAKAIVKNNTNFIAILDKQEKSYKSSPPRQP